MARYNYSDQQSIMFPFDRDEQFDDSIDLPNSFLPEPVRNRDSGANGGTPFWDFMSSDFHDDLFKDIDQLHGQKRKRTDE